MMTAYQSSLSRWHESRGHGSEDRASEYNWFFNTFTISSRSLSFGNGNFYNTETTTTLFLTVIKYLG